MIQVFIWWLAIQVIGLAALPSAYTLFRWLPDRGYTFSKILGLLLASYLLWFGASAGLLQNDLGGAVAGVLGLVGISAWLYLRRTLPSGERILPFLRRNLRLVISAEVLFTLGLVAWSILRAYASFKIQPAGGEKFMEIAFLNGILNSASFPPLDPWLSGFAIAYYYFGYVMMAFMTRLTGALPGIAFDLTDALAFALTLLGAFGVVSNLVAAFARRGETRPVIAYGLLGALLVVVMGNLSGLLESLHASGLLPAAFWTWIDIPELATAPVTGSFEPAGGGWFWWWRGSRIIQDYNLAGQPMGPNISEFPFFSFLLGDNHPHKLALPFVLLAIGLGLNLFNRQLLCTTPAPRPALDRREWWNPAATALDGDWALFIFTALALGALGFLNTWDMPIYIGLTVLAYALGMFAVRRKFDPEVIRRALVLGVWFLVASFLFYIFFYFSFDSQAGGILPYINSPTRLPLYLVMFGPFVFILAWFLVARLAALSRAESLTVSQAQPSPLRQTLSAWGWVALACVGLVVFGLLLAVLLNGGFAAVRQALSDPAVQTSLGGLPLPAALRAFLFARLQNPWLFLLLSLGLALAAVNVFITGKRPSPDGATGAFASQTEIQSSQTPSHPADLFVLLLTFTGLALTFSVEFFFLRDLFGSRMNTVFKFYYQGWVLLALASAYAVWWLLHLGRQVLGSLGTFIFQTGAALLIAAGMIYTVFAAWNRVEGFTTTPDLDAASEIASASPADWAVIEWLRANGRPPGQPAPVILEAPAGSYQYEGRISAFTGFPTVLGWAGHEAQWRGSYEEQGQREPDIRQIFTTSNPQTALELLQKWGVRYLVLGDAEVRYIQKNLCPAENQFCNSAAVARALRKFETALEPVFQQGNTVIYAVPQ